MILFTNVNFLKILFFDIIFFQILACNRWKSTRIRSAGQTVPTSRVWPCGLGRSWRHVPCCSRPTFIAFHRIRIGNHGVRQSRHSLAPIEISGHIQRRWGQLATGHLVLGSYGRIWKLRTISFLEIRMGTYTFTEINCRLPRPWFRSTGNFDFYFNC